MISNEEMEHFRELAHAMVPRIDDHYCATGLNGLAVQLSKLIRDASEADAGEMVKGLCQMVAADARIRNKVPPVSALESNETIVSKQRCACGSHEQKIVGDCPAGRWSMVCSKCGIDREE
jgi:hypothetical protein